MLSTDELMVFLADSGIASSQRLRVFQEHLRRRKHELESVDELARELVQAGLITEYQAEEIGHGQKDRLVFGNYVLIDRIGRGGMGEVYRARHTLMQRDVAIKFLGPTAVDRIGSVRRFQREVRAAAKLIHPNIVTALDAGERDGTCYLVMELVRGATLSQHVRRGGPLTIPHAVELTLQVAEALAFAHSRGIVHRDIKPGNLILSEQGKVKVLDLGLSRLRTPPEHAANPDHADAGATDPHLTEFGNFMGTVDFMAPEQAIDPHDVDERADVYSLGCTLYYLLTGNPPFPGKSVLDRLLAHRDGAIPSLSESRPEAPPLLEALLQRMLAKSANQRLKNMEEVVVKLKEIQREVGEPSSDIPVTLLFTPDNEAADAAGAGWRWALVGSLLLATIVLALWWRPWTERGTAGDSSVVEQTGSIDGSGPVDLLQHIDVARDSLRGNDWKLENGRLVTSSMSPSMLAVNHSVSGDYVLEIAGRRLSGAGPLVVGLVIGEHKCYLLLDASRSEGSLFAIGTTRSGRLVDFQHREPLFVIGKPFQLRCHVRSTPPASISVTAGDEVLVEWSGDPADLFLGGGWEGSTARQMFLGTNNNSSFSIERLILAPLPEPSPADADTGAEQSHSTVPPDP